MTADEEKRLTISRVVNFKCPGTGIKSFLFELNQFVYGNVKLYGWKECSNPGKQGNCGAGNYCCRHPFGDNVCYEQSYLKQNEAKLLL